jgi:hypothetical protein
MQEEGEYRNYWSDLTIECVSGIRNIARMCTIFVPFLSSEFIR